jgi:hypothetical protein
MDRNFIDRYARGIGLLSYATAGLTAEEWTSRPGPGAWSTAEVVLHLADADLVLADRMKRVIAEEQPLLVAFDENQWTQNLFYQDRSAEPAPILFDFHRQQMLEVLRRLDDGDFERVGIHSERGPLTLAQIVAGAADHLDHHLKFVYEKRQRFGRPLPARYSRTE